MNFAEWVQWVMRRREALLILEKRQETCAFDLRNIRGLQEAVDNAAKVLLEHLSTDLDGDYVIQVKLKLNPGDLRLTASVKASVPQTVSLVPLGAWAVRENGELRLLGNNQTELFEKGKTHV